MNFEDLVEQLNSKKLNLYLKINDCNIFTQEFSHSANNGEKILKFLKSLKISNQNMKIDESNQLKSNLENFTIFFSEKKIENNERINFSKFYEELNLKIKNKTEEAKLRNEFCSFFYKFWELIKNSIDCFSKKINKIDYNVIKNLLTEILECVELDLLRINSISNSSEKRSKLSDSVFSMEKTDTRFFFKNQPKFILQENIMKEIKNEFEEMTSKIENNFEEALEQIKLQQLEADKIILENEKLKQFSIKKQLQNFSQFLYSKLESECEESKCREIDSINSEMVNQIQKNQTAKDFFNNFQVNSIKANKYNRSYGTTFGIDKIMNNSRKNKTFSNIEKEIFSLESNSKLGFGFFELKQSNSNDLSLSTDRMLSNLNEDSFEKEMKSNFKDDVKDLEFDDKLFKNESSNKSLLSENSEKVFVLSKNPFELSSQQAQTSNIQESKSLQKINLYESDKESLHDEKVELSKPQSQKIKNKLSKRLQDILESSKTESNNMLKDKLKNLKKNSSPKNIFLTNDFKFFGSNLVSHIMEEFLKPEIDENHKNEIENRIKEMPRFELENKVIEIEQDLFKMRMSSCDSNIKDSFSNKLKTFLKRVNKEFQKYISETLEKKEIDYKKILDSLDVTRMENIELEYGLIKLSHIYNEIVAVLDKNKIVLEILKDEDEKKSKNTNSEVSSDIKSSSEKVLPFSLKNFKEDIKNKIQNQKCQLDKHFKGISQINEENEEEINLDNFDIISETEFNSTLEKNPKTDISSKMSNYYNHNYLRGKSLLIQKPDKNFPKRLSIIEKKPTLLNSPTNKKSIWKRSESFVMDFKNKINDSDEGKKMEKSFSGGIKTVKEMKEEYYNTKKNNIELIAENVELGKLNNELNSQIWTLENEKQNLQEKIENFKIEKKELLKNEEELENLREINISLIEEKRVLIEDAEGMKNFLICNFEKVKEELQIFKSEVQKIRKKSLSNLFNLRLFLKREINPQFEKLNTDLDTMIYMNNNLEEQKKKIEESIEETLLISEREKSDKEKLKIIIENLEQIRQFMQESDEEDIEIEIEKDIDLFYHQKLSKKNTNEFLDDKDESKEENNLVMENKNKKLIINPKNFASSNSNNIDNSNYTINVKKDSIDYNKLIYSESDLTSKKDSKEVNIHENYLNSLDKLSLNKEFDSNNFKSNSFQRNSKYLEEQNSENLSQYQINYNEENSKTNNSVSDQSEEYDNGMDVLMQEYMSQNMEIRQNNQEGTFPPYNTERNKSVNIQDYLLNPQKTQEKCIDKTENENKDFKISLNSKGELNDLVKRKSKRVESENYSIPLSDDIDNDNSFKFNKLQDNTWGEGGFKDRESGFENISDKLILMISSKNKLIREMILKQSKDENEKLNSNENHKNFSKMSNTLSVDKKGLEFNIENLNENLKVQIANLSLKEISKILNESSKTENSSIKNSLTTSLLNNLSNEDLQKKFKMMKSENSFLIVELQKIKNKMKDYETENSQIKSDNLDLIKQSNDYENQILTLQERVEFLTSDNKTEIGTEYDDIASNMDDIHSQRLSNDMLIIKEEENEYDEEDSFEEQHFKPKQQLGLIRLKSEQLGNLITDQNLDIGSIESKSNYSFMKDYGKSEIFEDEAVNDNENESNEFNNSKKSKKIISVKRKKLKRRATLGSSSKDINKHVEEFSRSGTSRFSKNRKTISSIGRSITNKSNFNNTDFADQLISPESALRESRLSLKEHPNTSKSNDFNLNNKINLKNIIDQNNKSKSFNQQIVHSSSSNLKNTNSNSDEHPTFFKFQNSNMTGSDFIQQASPLVSIISQEKPENCKKFNFSKNFKELDEVESLDESGGFIQKSNKSFHSEEEKSKKVKVLEQKTSKDFDIFPTFTFSSSSSEGFKKFQRNLASYKKENQDIRINFLKKKVESLKLKSEKQIKNLEVVISELLKKLLIIKESVSKNQKQNFSKKKSIKEKISCQLDLFLNEKSPIKSSSSKKSIPIQQDNIMLKKFLEKKKEKINQNDNSAVLQEELNQIKEAIDNLFNMINKNNEEFKFEDKINYLTIFIEKNQNSSYSLIENNFDSSINHNIFKEQICIKDGNIEMEEYKSNQEFSNEQTSKSDQRKQSSQFERMDSSNFETKLNNLQDAYLEIEKQMDILKQRNTFFKSKLEENKIFVSEKEIQKIDKKIQNHEMSSFNNSSQNPIKEINLRNNDDDLLKEIIIDLIEVFYDSSTPNEEKYKCVELFTLHSFQIIKNSYLNDIPDKLLNLPALNPELEFEDEIEEEIEYIDENEEIEFIESEEENVEDDFENLKCEEDDLEPELEIKKKTLTEIREEELENFTSQENNKSSIKKMSPKEKNKKDLKQINFLSSPLIDNRNLMSDKFIKRKSKSLNEIMIQIASIDDHLQIDNKKFNSNQPNDINKINNESNKSGKNNNGSFDEFGILKSRILSQNEEIKDLIEENQIIINKNKEMNFEVLTLKNEIEELNKEINQKDESISDLKDKINNLKNLNKELALEYEIQSQEIASSMIRSPEKFSPKNNSSKNITQNINFKTLSEFSSQNRTQEKKKKSSEDNIITNITQKKIRFFNLANQLDTSEMKDRSEFPKGFSIDSIQNEEISKLKEKILIIENEKNEILEDFNELKENSKLKIFTLKEKISFLEQKIEKKNKIFKQEKLMTNSQNNLEIKKKNDQIERLTKHIKQLQNGVNNLSGSDNMRESEYRSDNSSSQRKPSITEKQNILYSQSLKYNEQED